MPQLSGREGECLEGVGGVASPSRFYLSREEDVMVSSNAGTRTSLPQEIGSDIRSGHVLAGDDYSPEQISRWFSQEKEAFFSDDQGNSHIDPFYAYMRSLTRRLGGVALRELAGGRRSMLVLGPGSGLEIEEFIGTDDEWRITLIEASENFRQQLAQRFPTSVVIPATESGELQVPSKSVDLILALSVLHHIPNVSFVLGEFARILKDDGFAIIREPCSSMGDWRKPRLATPNERGIGKSWMLEAARRVGLVPAQRPVPILFHPLSILTKKLGVGRLMHTSLYYRLDAAISRIFQCNDHYWRDSWRKKLGPSAYFYVFKKPSSRSVA
jgi:SAM-dependent methyltransferase